MNEKLDLKSTLAQLSAPERAELLARLKAKQLAQTELAVEGPYPLSPFQKRVWTSIALNPESTLAYTIHTAFRFETVLNPTQLAHAIRQVLQRYEVLRSRFFEQEGSLWQAPQPIDDWQLQVVSTTGDVTASLRDASDSLRSTPFDLRSELLFQAVLCQPAGGEVSDGDSSGSGLLIRIHHIVCDGISLEQICSDLAHFYTQLSGVIPATPGGASHEVTKELPTHPANIKQFRQYVDGTRETDLRASLDYWRGQFTTPPETLDILLDKPRPAVPDLAGESRRRILSSELRVGLERLCAQHSSTLFMGVLALVYATLAKLTRVEDLVVGVPVSGRSQRDTLDVVGPFVNTLALRRPVDLSQSFLVLLRSTRTAVLEGMRHQMLPFESLVGSLPFKTEASRLPLFDVMLGLTDEQEAQLTLDGFLGHPIDVTNTTAKVDLTFHFVALQSGALALELEYATALFDEGSIDSLLSSTEQLLGAALRDPGRALQALSLTSRQSADTLLLDVNRLSARTVTETSLLDQFDTMVAAHADSAAVMTPTVAITYASLDGLSRRLSRRLIDEFGVVSGEPVAIMLEKDEWPIIAMLGILRAGACYVPLAVDSPQDRVEAVATAAKIRLLLCDQPQLSASALPQIERIDIKRLLTQERQSVHSTARPLPALHGLPDIIQVNSSALAYVMFTSGTTGIPKGVVIDQAAILRLVIDTDFHQVQAGERVLLTGSLAFDAATFEIWGPLLNGGTVCIPEGTTLLDIDSFDRLMTLFSVDTLFMTTGLFNQVVNRKLAAFENVTTVLTGGEKISVSHARRLRSAYPELRLLHVYGPTENTTFSSWHPISADDLDRVTVPIGRPVANSELYVLDQSLNILPRGAVGDIYCGGQGLALGYLDDDETDARFDFADIAGEQRRLYKTGDLGRWNSDWQLEFLGRSDRQTKIRGFRIELGEVEFQLRAIDAISDAYVIAEMVDDKRELIAYLVPVSEEISATSIRDRMRVNAPAYLIPSKFIFLTTLPLNASGKVDRRALPDWQDQLPVASADGLATQLLAPQEARLVEWVADTLKLTSQDRQVLTLDDNFFSLGGDSILAIQLIAAARKAGFTLELKDIFQSDNLSDLSQRLIDAELSADVISQSLPARGPLSPVQQWWLERIGQPASHFNLSAVLRFEGVLDVDALRRALADMVKHHAALRLRLDTITHEQWVADADAGEFSLRIEHHDEMPTAASRQLFWQSVQRSVDLSAGINLAMGVLVSPTMSLIGLVVHHIAADEVSSSLYLNTLRTAYASHCARDAKTSQRFIAEDAHPVADTLALQHCVETGSFDWERAYWLEVAEAVQLAEKSPLSSIASCSERGIQGTTLTPVETAALLRFAKDGLKTDLQQALLASFVLAWRRAFNNAALSLMLESHGRHPSDKVNRGGTTAGWFTALYPCFFAQAYHDETDALRSIKGVLASIPNHGISYLPLRYFSDEAVRHRLSINPLVSFNFLGDLSVEKTDNFRMVDESCGDDHAENLQEPFALDVLAWISEGQLRLELRGVKTLVGDEAHDLSSIWRQVVTDLSETGVNADADAQLRVERLSLSPAECIYPFHTLSDLDLFCADYGLAHAEVEGILPVTGMQSGMLVAATSGVSAYADQVVLQLHDTLDEHRFASAVEALVAEAAILRTGFAITRSGDFAQVIFRQRTGVFSFEKEQFVGADSAVLGQFREQARCQPEDYLREPLVSFHLIRLADSVFQLMINFHHVAIDGWTSALLLSRLETLYRGKAPDFQLLGMDRYFQWLQQKETQKAKGYWENLVGDYQHRVELPSSYPRLADRVPHPQSEIVVVASPLLNRLQAWCDHNRVTLNALVQTAWSTILSSETGHRDVVIGATVSGREATIDGITSIAGMLINTLPVRLMFDADQPISLLVKEVGQQFAKSLAHGHLALADIQALSLARNHLITHTLVFENYPQDDVTDGWNWQTVDIFDPMQFDFGLIVAPHRDTLSFRFVFDAKLHASHRVKALGDRLIAVLESAIAEGQTSEPLRDLATADVVPGGWLVTANFTADPMLDTLQLFEHLRGTAKAVGVAPYDQIVQQFSNPVSELMVQCPDCHIVLWRPQFDDQQRIDVVASMAQLQDIVEAITNYLRSRPDCSVYLAIAPWQPFDSKLYQQLLDYLATRFSAFPQCRLFRLTPDEFPESFESGVYKHDAIFGDIPFSEAFFASVAGGALRLHDLGCRKPVKVVAVDADNTLWRGVLGEDGVEGLLVEPCHAYLQEKLVSLRESGVLICLVTKNNPEDVEALFSQRVMPLRREHFTRIVATWSPKSEGIRSLATDLSLGLDSFVFIDDSPLECAEVSDRCPMTKVIQLPPETHRLAFLQHLWLLDIGEVTDEDHRRTQMYEDELLRVADRGEHRDYQQFLESLAIEVGVDNLAPGDSVRVAQLSLRTNQFNFSGITFSQTDVTRWVEDPQQAVKVIRVTDRYGDYGLVGSAFLRESEQALCIESFMLSCRVLGRGVERTLLADLTAMARNANREFIEVRFANLPRNRPAKEFLDRYIDEQTQTHERDGATYYRFRCADIERVSEMALNDQITSPAATEKQSDKANDTSGQSAVAPMGSSEMSNGEGQFYSYVAEHFTTGDAILAVQRQLFSWGGRGKTRRSIGETPLSTAVEMALSEWFDELLQCGECCRDTHFFESGGQSLKLTMLLTRIQHRFGISLELADVMAQPTVASIAQAIAQASANDHATIVPPVLIEERLDYPLSPGQQRLWMLDQLQEASTALNMNVALLGRGTLNGEAFQHAVSALAHDNEALRTEFFDTDDGVRQRIIEIMPLDQVVEFRPDPIQQDECLREAALFSRQPFCLNRAPLWRIRIIPIASGDTLVLIALHHSIADGGSTRALSEALSRLYGKTVSDGIQSSDENVVATAERAFQYRDYVVWLQQWLQSDQGEAALEFWKQIYAIPVEPLHLPATGVRPTQRSGVGSSTTYMIPAESGRALNRVARSENVTLFSAVLACFQLTLARVSGQTDFCIGTVVSGRPSREFESTIGFFANVLPLRARIDWSESPAELLASVQRHVSDCLAHQLLPFDLLVEALAVARDPSRTPLFDVLIAFQDDVGELSLGGEVFDVIDVPSHTSQYELTLNVFPEGEGLVIRCEYDSEIHSEDSIALILRTFETILGSFGHQAEQPGVTLGAMDWVSQWDQTQVEGWSGVAGEASHNNIVDAVRAVVSSSKRIADLNHSWSYAELLDASDRLALVIAEHAQRERGPQGISGHRIGVLGDRSIFSVAALLGVMQANCAVVPLDINSPDERLIAICTEGDLSGVIATDAAAKSRLDHLARHLTHLNVWAFDACADTEMTLPPIVAGSPAYIIFTSGTTGRPKGVVVSHAAFMSMIAEQVTVFDIQPADICGQFASLSFDASLSEIFLALTVGAGLDIAPEVARQDPVEYRRWLQQRSVSVVTLPPAFLRLLDQQSLSPVRVLITAGEAAVVDDLIAYRQTQSVFNAYGPTEASVCATVHHVVDRDYPFGIPIGRPLRGVKVSVQASDGAPVPVLVAGELTLHGPTIADEYFNQPELSAAVFDVDTVGQNTGRSYRTGDWVRWNPDGELEFLGRRDRQVKIRGHRVEMGEIESAARQMPRCLDAAALHDADRGLCLFVVSKQQSPLLKADLRHYLQQSLPSYMAPHEVVIVEALPRNLAGKVDHKKLMDRLPRQAIAATAVASAASEQIIAGVWRDVLNRSEVAMTDHFFDLGGDSIKAMRAMTQLRKRGVSCQLKTFFDHSILAEFIQNVGEVKGEKNSAQLKGGLGLLPIQKWFFASRTPEAARHFNLAIDLVLPQPVSLAVVTDSLSFIVMEQDALRARFAIVDGGWGQTIREFVPPSLMNRAVTFVLDDDPASEAAQVQRQEIASSVFALDDELLIRVIASGSDTASITKLTLVVHHLVCDWVSLRILITQLDDLLSQPLSNEPLDRSFARGVIGLVVEDRAFSLAQAPKSVAVFDGQTPLSRRSDLRTQHLSIDIGPRAIALVNGFTGEDRSSFRWPALLLSCFIDASRRLWAQSSVTTLIESHGRHGTIRDNASGREVSLDSVIGWLTQAHCVEARLDLPFPELTEELTHRIATAGEASPEVFEFMAASAEPTARLPADVSFNYLGDFSSYAREQGLQLAETAYEDLVALDASADVALQVELYVMGNYLEVQVAWCGNHYSSDLINNLLPGFQSRLLAALSTD